jgi:hypothetical protein
MFPEGENRSYFLFIKHLGSWADLSQDAIDLDHDLSLAIEVLRTYDAKCSVSGDAVQPARPAPTEKQRRPTFDSVRTLALRCGW